MKDKKLILIGAVVFVVVSSLLLGGVLLYTSNPEIFNRGEIEVSEDETNTVSEEDSDSGEESADSSEEQISEADTDSATEEIVCEGTENWLDYSNSEYGFNFKYPENYSVTEAENPPTSMDLLSYFEIDEPGNDQFSIALTVKDYSVDEYLRDWNQEENSTDGYEFNVSSEEINLGSKDVYEILVNGGEEWELIWESNNYFYILEIHPMLAVNPDSQDSYKSIAKDIVCTFEE